MKLKKSKVRASLEWKMNYINESDRVKERFITGTVLRSLL